MNKYISLFCILFVTVFSLSLSVGVVHAAQIPPQIFTYQGRLTNSGGTLLTGTYYFKFSIWTASAGGSQVWPADADPTYVSATVSSGVFTVNIGDTVNGYPYPLNLDFSANPNVYLQIRISSASDSGYETLSPRQQITSAAFAQVAGAVVGTTTPSIFGTLTQAANSFVTMAATSIASIPLTIVGFLGQVANLFQVQDSTGANLFSVDASGNATVQTAVIFGNKFKLEQTGASTTIMYDTTNTAIFEFDESSI